MAAGLAVWPLGTGAAATKDWDQAAAKKMVAKVLEVEKAKKRPWNRIPWRAIPSTAVEEAKKSGKPIFVFFFVEQPGPPLEPCGLEGRLVRTHALSDSTVLSIIKSNFIPVKVKLQKGKDFPVDWPALEKWATAYKFSNSRGFAGCSVVSADLEVEYGNSGTATLWDLFHATAFNAEKFEAMLERAAARMTEERSLRAQRGISDYERKAEIYRLRRGVTFAVRSEGRAGLPPRGYSLEKALELYQMAGAVEKPPGTEAPEGR